MTPAIQAAKKHKIQFSIHEYDHDPDHASYGLEASEKLGIPESKVFKTLVVELDNKTFAVGILPVSDTLSMKLIAKAAGVKKAKMADKTDVERITGYVLGGVSPLGQKKRLVTALDATATEQSTIYVSAGRRGLEIELSPADLLKVTGGKFADLRQV